MPINFSWHQSAETQCQHCSTNDGMLVSHFPFLEEGERVWYIAITVNSLLTDSLYSGLLPYNGQLTWSQLTLACFVYKKNTSIADTPSILNSGRWPRSQVTFLIEKNVLITDSGRGPVTTPPYQLTLYPTKESSIYF